MTPSGNYGASTYHSEYSPRSPATARARMIAEIGDSVVAKMDHIRGIANAAHAALMTANDARNEARMQRYRAQQSVNEMGDLERARRRNPEEVAARESELEFAVRRYDQACARYDRLQPTYEQALSLSASCVRSIKNRVGGFLIDQLIDEMEWN